MQLSSLRARQKVARQEQVLEAARTLFLQHGYSKTNMDSIADAAVVGVATIYAYFVSKEGVLAELFRKDMNEVGDEAEQLLKKLPEDPADGILALLDTYEKALSYVSYKFMTEFIIQSKTKGLVRDAFIWCRDWQTAQIKQALELSQAAGTVSPQLDTDVAATVVNDIHVQHLSRIAGENYTQGTGHIDLEKALEMLFISWRA